MSTITMLRYGPVIIIVCVVAAVTVALVLVGCACMSLAKLGNKT